MSGAGAVEWIRIDRTATDALRRAASECGVTLNMFVMALYAAMLTEPLGRDALVLGVPVRGRSSTQLESIMGFFNNLLPMRLDVDRGATVRAWTARVKHTLVEGFAHQDVPFERLSTEPGLGERAQRSGALYQSLFSFQDARDRRRDWGPLRHASILVMQKGATEDFGLWLMEVPGGLEGGFNYNADVFDATTAARFRERLVELLARAALDPDQRLDALLERPVPEAIALRRWVDERSAPASLVLAPGPHADPHADAPAVRVERPALSETEARLAQIWATLLGVEVDAILAQDHFFDLGGNSMMVMQAIAAMEHEAGHAVEPRRYVFENLGQIAAAWQASKTAPAPKSGLLARLFGGKRR